MSWTESFKMALTAIGAHKLRSVLTLVGGNFEHLLNKCCRPGGLRRDWENATHLKSSLEGQFKISWILR